MYLTVLFLLRLLDLCLAIKHLLQRVENPAQKERAEQVFDGQKRVSDAQQHRGHLEVDEEDDDAEVDQGVRRGDQVRLLVQNENGGRRQTRFGGAGRKKSTNL